MPQTLSKKERLSSKKDIGVLMKAGRWGVCGGLKYCYLVGNGTLHESASEDPAGVRAQESGKSALNRIMVSVPKKFFKRAVKRNLLKRRLRESYRRQKNLIESVGGGVDIMFQYNTADILSYEYLYALVGKILENIASKQ